MRGAAARDGERCLLAPRDGADTALIRRRRGCFFATRAADGCLTLFCKEAEMLDSAERRFLIFTLIFRATRASLAVCFDSACAP